jgi:hypothetical protein
MRRVLAIACLCGLASCSGGQRDARGSGDPARAVPSLARGVPASSAVIAWAGSSAPIAEFLRAGWLGGELSPAEFKALRDELAAFLVDEIGIDLLAVTSATAFLVPIGDDDAAAAVIVPAVQGAPRHKPAYTTHGTPVVVVDDDLHVAVRDQLLLVGNKRGVELAVAVLAGRERPLEPQSTVAQLLVAEGEGAVFAVAADLSKLPPLPPDLASFGVRAGMLVWNRAGPRLILRGQADGLDQLVKLVRAQIDSLLALADVNRRTMKMSGKVAEAIAGILGAHQAHHLARSIAFERTGDRLAISVPFRTEQPGYAVAVIGVLAALAIPAFDKYIERHDAASQASRR